MGIAVLKRKQAMDLHRHDVGILHQWHRCVKMCGYLNPYRWAALCRAGD